LSGAEPVRLSTIEAFESHFGLKRVISPCYGLAEATLAVAIWPRGVPLRHDPSGRFLSVGKPCRGVSVRVLAPLDEGTAERPAGVEGEICVKSPGIMKGYYNNPAATEKVLMPGGWLRTGDLGFVDAEGFLFVTGRLKDLIILGGQNVVPADIEEVVDRVDGVRYSAAVGIDSERMGTQRLHVVAEVRGEDAAPDDFHDLVREITGRVHRASGHRPARVIPYAIASRYPYNPTGDFPLAPSTAFLEPLVALGLVAGVTERVRLGTTVLVLPHRHPVLAAKMLATLDHLAPGRVILGAGVGWLREEIELFGVDYARRGAWSDEALRIMRTCWREERPSFRGEFVSFDPVGFAPKPAHGTIPIWIGGHTPRAL